MSEKCEQIGVDLWELHIATATRFYALACILIFSVRENHACGYISYGINNLLHDKHSNEKQNRDRGSFTKEQLKINCIWHQILLYFVEEVKISRLGSNTNGLI